MPLPLISLTTKLAFGLGCFNMLSMEKLIFALDCPLRVTGTGSCMLPPMLKSNDYSIMTASPKKKSAIFAIVYPYEAILWPFVLVTIIVMSLVFKLVPVLQRKVDAIRGSRSKCWKRHFILVCPICLSGWKFERWICCLPQTFCKVSQYIFPITVKIF